MTSAGGPDEVFALVRTHLLAIRPDLVADGVQPDRSMRELGVNSLDRLDVVVATLTDLGVDVPNDELAAATDLGELAEIIHRHR
ncbi:MULTISPECIES: phosphopantetheine-binding protein [Streptomyces]|uniref:Phosphopantetheine-binding protein n=1 Tax=Streptomyces yunnanensis TaxID=156453 RepID=A0ABY8A7B6_9ACTN|nr:MULTISPECIES: phosphopantetheine-binding protein [Streptomyces]AJC59426.1 acyl carrier protein [Streptomyces sp. 769]WEB39587.1 phosphopantetheine-binding protein [Streptomyces yunnanensis]